MPWAAESDGGAGFNFVEALRKGDVVMRIDGQGVVHSSGLIATGQANVESWRARGHAILDPATVVAGDALTLPCNASFVRVASDGAPRANVVELPGSTCSLHEGQLLVVQNADEQSLGGDAAVPPGRSVLFIFSQLGTAGWIPLTTLDALSSRLEGVTALTAANNIDLGPWTFKAQQLVAAGQTKDQLSVYGAGGLLVGDPSLTYTDGLLTTPKINVKQVCIN